MDEAERRIFDNLPEEVTIYRGVQSKKHKRGLSWTLSYEKAEWFANRYSNENPIVYKTVVPKKHILCYIDRRNEEEIIVNPQILKEDKIEEIA